MYQAISTLLGYSGHEYDVIVYIISAVFVVLLLDRITAFLLSFFRR